jgi:hypothetical protein
VDKSTVYFVSNPLCGFIFSAAVDFNPRRMGGWRPPLRENLGVLGGLCGDGFFSLLFTKIFLSVLSGDTLFPIRKITKRAGDQRLLALFCMNIVLNQ